MQEDKDLGYSDNELAPEDIDAMGEDATRFEEPQPEADGFGETLSPEDLGSADQDIPDYLQDDNQ